MNMQSRVVTKFVLFTFILYLLPVAPNLAIASSKDIHGGTTGSPSYTSLSFASHSNQPTLYIHGQVVESFGQSGSNLRVRLMLPDGHIAQEVVTSATGDFQFEPVGTESYQLWVIAPDGRPLVWEGDQIFHVPAGRLNQPHQHTIRLVESLMKEEIATAKLAATTEAVTDTVANTVGTETHNQVVASQEPNPVTTGQFTVISGTVTAADTGQPLGGVGISAYDATGRIAGQGATESDTGSYRITLRQGGSYRLFFDTSLAFDVTKEYAPQYYKDKSSLEEADLIEVQDGVDSGGYDVALKRAALLSGTVTAADTGAPLNFARVILYTLNEQSVQSDSTNSDGTYQLTGLPAGSYKVRVEPSFSDDDYFEEYYDNQISFADANTIKLSVGEARVLDVALERAGAIGGVVSDGNTGAPLAGVQLELYSTDGETVEQQVSSAQGEYLFTGLRPGSYRLYADPGELDYIAEYHNNQTSLESADEIAVATAQTTTVDVGLTRGARIVGTVTDEVSGAAVGGIEVTLYSDEAEQLAQTQTDSSGQYSFVNLSDGNYHLRFGTINAQPSDETTARYVPEYHNNKATLKLADTVTLAPPEVKTVNAALTPAGRIAGRVSDSGSDAALAGIHVTAYNQRGVLQASTSTGTDGRYTLANLLAGSYWLYFEAPDSGPAAAYGSQHLLDSVNVTPPGTTGDINMRLTLLGQIDGTITNSASGTPLDNLVVQVYDEDGFLVDSTVTDANGQYRTAGLKAGSYTLYAGVPAAGNNNSYEPAFYAGKRNLLEADFVQVSGPGLTEGINLSLTRRTAVHSALVTGEQGRIEGYVTSTETGEPLMVTVQLQDSDGNVIRSTTSSRLDGAYHFSVDAGTYYVFVDAASSPYISRYWSLSPASVERSSINLPSGGTRRNISIELAKGAQITGRVSDAVTALPIFGVTVEVYDVTAAQWLDSIRTNATGHYITDGLPDGVYRLRFSERTAYLGADYPDAVEISGGMSATDIDMELMQGAAILGRVMDEASREPASGVPVRLGECESIAYDTTNWLGLYTLDGLTGGTYTVHYGTEGSSSFSPYLPVSVPGVTVTAPNELVRHQTLTRGGQILGVLIAEDTAKPLTDVDIYAYRENSLSRYVETNDAGAFALRGLSDGEYIIRFLPDDEGASAAYVREYYNDTGNFNNAQAVTITGLNTAHHTNAVLTRGGRVAGRITAADTGAPLSNVDVDIYAMDGAYFGTTETDNDGNYVTPGVPTGDYQIFFQPIYHWNSAVYAYQYYNGKVLQAEGDPVSVAVAQITNGINAALQRGGRITGNVTDKNGNALDGALISLYDSNGTYVTYSFTDEDGTYQTPGLPTGNYRLHFSYNDSCASQSAESYYTGKADLETADRVNVTATEVVPNINASLNVTVLPPANGTPTPPIGTGSNKIYLPSVNR